MQKFMVVKGHNDKQHEEINQMLSEGWKVVEMQSQPVDEGSPLCFLLLEKED